MMDDSEMFRVRVPCCSCGTIYFVECRASAYLDWKNGQHIQNAMPELSEGQRELLISQTCEGCFEMFDEDHAEVELNDEIAF